MDHIMNRYLKFIVALIALIPGWVIAQPKPDSLQGIAADAELTETRTEVPRLKAPAPFEMKDNTVLLELSEYAGYSGLIVANNGMEPNENSIFFKKHGFKVKI